MRYIITDQSGETYITDESHISEPLHHIEHATLTDLYTVELADELNTTNPDYAIYPDDYTVTAEQAPGQPIRPLR